MTHRLLLSQSETKLTRLFHSNIDQNRLKVQKNVDPVILYELRQDELIDFYHKCLDRNFMHPAQWFKDASKWYQIHTFNNPFNLGSPNAELSLLLANQNLLASYMDDMALIFWGVGKSDTEMELVNYQLQKRKSSFILAIDANSVFLEDFGNSLLAKAEEDISHDLFFIGVNDLFENICIEDSACFSNKNKMHICLGNSIGNYDNLDEILRIFERNISSGDFLVISFQTNKNVDAILKKYCNNKYIESLIVPSLAASLNLNPEELETQWTYNAHKSQVEAWCNDVQIFRSKKFDPDELSSTLSSYRLELKQQFKDDFATCIQIYECRE